MSSNTRKTTLTEDIRAWSTAIVVCLGLMLGLVSTGYGAVNVLGNFESADSNDGWLAYYDTSQSLNLVNDVILSPDCPNGVTLGHGSLSLTPDSSVGYWCLRWETGTPLKFTRGTFFKFDLTELAADWPDQPWTKVGAKLAVNSDGPSGWTEYGPDETGDTNLYSVIDRDTGEPSTFDWGAWDGDAKKTYTYDVSSYNATGATWMNINLTVQGGNGTGRFYFDNIRLVTPDVIVNKCTVTAGKTQYMGDDDYNDMKDTFAASGSILLPTDVNDINSVGVTITSPDGNVIYPTEDLNDFSATTVNKTHKYTHSAKLIKGQAGKITSLTLDFRKGTFAITGKNLNLTGLACPFELKFTMAGNELKGYADESIVNGPKTTIPTRLMRMYKDTLIVPPGKTKVKSSTKASSDSLSVTGEIAVEDINTTDPNLYALPVVISWSSGDDTNSQTFTIPLHSFKIPKTGHLYKLNKNITPTVTPVVDANTKVSGTIDLDKCTFTLSITKADLLAVSGQTKFGISFDTPHGEFDEVDDVNLAWKK